MGQYYVAIILGNNPDGGEKEVVRYHLRPNGYGSGAKLCEHSFLQNKFVKTFEQLICPSGIFYKSRIVWAGDYADKEENLAKCLYETVEDKEYNQMLCIKDDDNYNYCRYLVNHTKKQYVDKTKCISHIHPLPLLVCEGNKRGGGDYWGKNADLCGTWARDIISVEIDKPSDEYTEFVCDFRDE
jgi:hypothetical protein